MSKLIPINDVMMIEVGGTLENPLNLSGAPSVDEGVRFGVVVAISDFLTFFGFNTYMFDKSLMDEDLLKRIYEKYKPLVGKKVYWPERSESGTVVKYGDKEYAFLKWSALTAVEEDD